MRSTADHAEEVERERRRKLNRIARDLAERYRCTTRVIWDAASWLRHDPRVGDTELVVTWTVADAALVRHELGERIGRDRVLPAAPRVRRGRATQRADIPRQRPGRRD